jgi:ribosomal protein S27AE
MIDSFWERSPRVTYDCDEHGTVSFVRCCPHCGRFVKADETILVNGLGEISEMSNATCGKCGRVTMESEGYL